MLSPPRSLASWGHVAAVAVLFGLIVWAYHPSLGHAPRQDQCCWLLDTIDQDDFLSLTASTYSYTRTRVVTPGDSQLFRPVFFTLLSAEKALFGDNFNLWQWFGIVLHGIAVFLFLHVLLLIHRLIAGDSREEESSWITERRLLKGLAYGLAFFFALNFTVMEMVVWSHINGCLLFSVFVLAAMILILKILGEPAAAIHARTAGAFLLLLVSAFTYEIGQFFAILTGAALAISAWRDGRPGRALALFSLFASILLLYQGVNLLDQAVHSQQPDITLALIVQQACSPRTLEHAGRYVLYHAVQPFFPAQARWWFFGRIAIAEPVLTWENQVRAGPLQLASLAMSAACLLLLLRGLIRVATGKNRLRKLLIVFLPLSFFVVHGAVTVLGRMNIRVWPDILAINSYYVYFPLLGALTSLYAIWTCAACRTQSRHPWLVLPVYLILYFALVSLSVFGGVEVRQINISVKNALRPLRTTTKTLAQFITAHQHEPDFSFAVDAAVCDGTENCQGIPLPVILFKRYVNNKNPKYLFTLKDGKLLARRRGEEAPGQPSLPQVFPDLVRVGTFYNFFFFDGWYYGVRSQDGYYHPEREQYSSLIVDRTLEGAWRQAEEKSPPAHRRWVRASLSSPGAR